MPDSTALAAFFDAAPVDAGTWATMCAASGMAVFDNADVLQAARQTLTGHYELFGYVNTDLSTGSPVNPDNVKQQADTWLQDYPDLAGIFFDQTLDEHATSYGWNYMFDLYNHMHINHPGKHVFANVAGCQDPRVLMPSAGGGPACDIAQLVEKEAASYLSTWWDNAHQPFWLDPTLRNQIVHVVHSCSTPADMVRVFLKSESRNNKYLYVYDGTSGSYDHLSRYWHEQALGFLDGGDICDALQAEADEVRAQISGLDSEIKDLQADLSHAAPSEKPLIIKQIRACESQRKAYQDRLMGITREAQPCHPLDY